MDWDAHVLSHFPLIGELNHPWRWLTQGAGARSLASDCRRMLLNGNAIDLRRVPAEVTRVPLRAETVVQQRLYCSPDTRCHRKRAGTGDWKQL